MTVLSDIQKMRDELRTVKQQVETVTAASATHEEQINGKRGLSAAIDDLADEVKSLKRALWTVGGGFVLASLGFSFSVLTLIGGP